MSRKSPEGSGRTVVCLFLALAFAALIAAPAQADPCEPDVLASPKGNQLYLYFPTSANSSFPFPLNPFNAADLDPGIGSTTQLRDRIFDMVVDDYCEFNVKVNMSLTSPSPVVPRWQIVGLSSDSATVGGGILFGEAQAIDTNDNDPQDYARVYAKAFKDAYGGSGGPLNGTNSNQQRWVTAIAETTAHEAAHNYGAAHGHSTPRPNSAEDEANWHIMATGATGITGEMRVSRNRHFSDNEYEILGHNVGLNVKTLHNWDFFNTNNANANSMRIKILSNLNSLSVGWWYNLEKSPWGKPTVTYTGTTQSFRGSTYFVHNLDFTTPYNLWHGSTPGVVEPSVFFHTGASFEKGIAIPFDVQLFNNGTLLPLAPRLLGFDTGDVEWGSGDFNLNLFNPNPGAGALLLSEVQVLRSPRMIDINTMMRDMAPTDIRGLPVEFHSSERFTNMDLPEQVTLKLGNLTDKRTVDIQYGADDDCPPGSIGYASPEGPAGAGMVSGAGDGESVEVKYCHKGNALSLFPSTYTYIVAKVIDPNATYWDPEQDEFVTGPIENMVFYQVAGIVPDFNGNGTDDLIDIRTGISADEDGNGVPDEAGVETDDGVETDEELER